MKQIKTIRNLVVIALLALMTNFSYAQKIELESLNIINSDLRIEGGNLIIKENATVSLNSKINITGGNKDEFKVKIVFYGVDDNMKELTATAEYTYNKKSTTNGNNISLKLPTHTKVRLNSVAHFVDDWQGETTYMSVNDRTTWTKKSKIVLMLNGIAKPLNNGVCQYGRCFCIEGSQGNDCGSKEIIKFDSMVISQTIKKNKENDYTLWIETGFNQTHNQTGKFFDIPTLDQLVAWGELEAFITTEITDAKGKKETFTIPCDLSTDRGICLFNGQKSLMNPADGTITAVICHFRTAPGAQFGISSASLYLRNKTAYQKPSSDNFTWTETWVSKKEDYHLCHKNELSASYMDYKENDKTISVLIGLNNSKTGEPSDFEKKLSQRELTTYGVITWIDGNGKTFDQRMEAFETKEGLWQYKAEIAQSKAGEPHMTMAQLNLYATNKCQTTYKYTSVYKKDLNNKKPWDYKVKMEAIAVDNPLFQPLGNVSNNILALSFPASSVTVTNNSLVFNRGPISTAVVSVIGAVAVLGKKNSNDSLSGATSISVTIQFDEPGDGRVFYHWGSVVSTSNPKFAINLDSLKLKNSTIQNVEIRMVNGKNDTIVYDMNGEFAISLDGKSIFLLVEKSEKIKFKGEHYDFGKSSLTVTDYKTIKVANFSFAMKKGSSIPTTMEAVLKVKACNKEAEFVGVKLKLDEKTGLWTGSQTLTQTADCTIEVKDFKVNLENACGDSYTSNNGKFSDGFVCEDECLNFKSNDVCGKTTHF